MTLKKIVLLTSLIFASTLIINAQSYNNAIGLRLGSPNGLTYKHFVNQSDAFELMAGSRWNGFQLTALYERHQSINKINAFKFYYGAGAHFGVWDDYDNHPWFDRRDDPNQLVIGVDGILGLEYAFKEVPLALSLDWKPEFNLIGYNGVWAGDGGLSIKYFW